ncbi:MAG: ABC transporter ATP-binding protein [Candidatus Nanopelagicaceae bacterium]|nr:ABC transporter ATP-binding protein [Candidatus Nanopelagicaceae bacterium]
MSTLTTYVSQLRRRSPMDVVPFHDPGNPSISSPAALLFWLARNQVRVILFGAVFGVMSTLTLAVMPGFLGKAVQAIADHDEVALKKWVFIVFALGFSQSIASVIRHRWAVASWIITATRMKQIIARKASELGADLPRLISTGEVVSVNNNDVERMARGFDNIPRLIGSIISFIFVSIMLIRSSPSIGIIVIAGVPIMALVIAPIIGPLQEREAEQRRKLSHSTNLAADTVAGLRVLRGIGGEDAFIERFRLASQEVRAAAVRTAKARSLLQALQIVLPGLFILIVIFAGGNLVADGKMKVGELLSFYGYSAFLVLPLRVMTETAQRMTSAIVSARRVISLLSVTSVNTWGLEESPNSLGVVRDLISGIEIRTGEFLVIVSENPLISDELCDRLGGYIDADRVTIDDLPLTTFTRRAVRRTIYSQEKEPAILSGTIGSIFAVPHSGRLSIDQAIDAASARNILDSLEGEGLEAEVVERGRTLSGGERQRLSLARTLFVDAPIVILDDPTSAVDAHTETRIAQRLSEIRAGRTTVVFSNSPLILDRADRVELILNGEKQEQGTHNELLERSQKYRDLVMRGA